MSHVPSSVGLSPFRSLLGQWRQYLDPITAELLLPLVEEAALLFLDSAALLLPSLSSGTTAGPGAGGRSQGARGGIDDKKHSSSSSTEVSEMPFAMIDLRYLWDWWLGAAAGCVPSAAEPSVLFFFLLLCFFFFVVYGALRPPPSGHIHLGLFLLPYLLHCILWGWGWDRVIGSWVRVQQRGSGQLRQGARSVSE